MKTSARFVAGFHGHHIDLLQMPDRALARRHAAAAAQTDQCASCGSPLRIETDGNGGLVQTCETCRIESRVVRRMGVPGKKPTVREREG